MQTQQTFREFETESGPGNTTTDSPEDTLRLIDVGIDAKQPSGTSEKARGLEEPGDSSDRNPNEGTDMRTLRDRSIDLVSEDGRTVSTLQVFANTRSGKWELIKTGSDDVTKVRTEDGEVLTLRKPEPEDEDEA